MLTRRASSTDRVVSPVAHGKRIEPLPLERTFKPPNRAKTLALLAAFFPMSPLESALAKPKDFAPPPPLMMSPLRKRRGHIGGFDQGRMNEGIPERIG